MRSFLRLAIGGTAPLLLASAACGEEIIGVLPGALDQPQVHVQFRRPSDPSTIVNFDPVDESNYIITAILDTGASSHLLSNAAAGTDDPNTPGLGIAREEDGSGNQIIFNDVGGGGEVQFNVSEPLLHQLANRTLQSSFSLPGIGDPDFRPQQSDFSANSAPQRWQAGPANEPIPEDPLDLLLNPLAGINVVGMPAMLNKVVVMDSRGVNNLALDPFNFEKIAVLNTFVYDPNTPFDPIDAADPQTSDNPGIPATDRHIQLSYADFGDYVSTTPSGAVRPDVAHNPFVGKDPVRTARGIAQPDVPGIKVSFEGASTEGSFLLDTGAGASFISTDLADALGVEYLTGRGPGDPEDGADPLLVNELTQQPITGQFKLTLAAFGADDPNDPDDSSSITIAGFYLDSLLVRTLEGDASSDADDAHLNFIEAPVLVFDINVTDPVTGQPYSLDGIFGMNFLTASAIPPVTFDDLLNPITAPGAFDWIVYDEAAGTLGLTLVPEPSAAGLALIVTTALFARRPRRRPRR